MKTQARLGNGNSPKTRTRKSGQAPFRASLSARRRALMFRLVGHGIVSEKNGTAGGSLRLRPASSSKRELRGASRSVDLRAQFATCAPLQSNSNFQLPRFAGRELLRAALQFVIQDDGLRDFLHRFAHLLALLLQRAIRLFLADLHFPLQDSLGPLHELAGFKLAG